MTTLRPQSIKLALRFALQMPASFRGVPEHPLYNGLRAGALKASGSGR